MRRLSASLFVALCLLFFCRAAFAADPAFKLLEVVYEDGTPVPSLSSIEPYRLVTFTYGLETEESGFSYELSIETSEGEGSYSGLVKGTPPRVVHSFSLKPLESGAISIRALKGDIGGDILYSRFKAQDGTKPSPGTEIMTISPSESTVGVGRTFNMMVSLSRPLASTERIDWDVLNGELLEIVDIAPDGSRISLRATQVGQSYVSVSLVDALHDDLVVEAHLCLIKAMNSENPGDPARESSGSGGGCNAGAMPVLLVLSCFAVFTRLKVSKS